MEVQLDTSPIGSAGTLVAAALESSGHYLQAEALDLLANGLAVGLGGFMFVIAGIAAIIILAVGGNYKYGLWFFFGVPVFFWLVTARVPSTGAAWQFGDRYYDQAKVTAAADDSVDVHDTDAPDEGNGGTITTPSGEIVQVSWFFAEWNKFTSGIVQNFIRVLKLTDDYQDLNFLVKSERYEALFSMDVLDPKLKLFTDITLVKECGRYFALQKGLHNPHIESARRELILREIGTLGSTVQFSMNSYPHIRDWLYGQLPSSSGTVSRSYWDIVVDQTGFARDKARFTCDELWQVAIVLYRLHSEELVNLVIDMGRPEEMPREEARRQLIQKFKATSDAEDGALRMVTDSDEQGYLFLVNEVAARLVLKQLSSVNPHTQALTVDKGPQSWNVGDEVHSADVARSIRQLSHGIEFEGKGDFLTAMLSLPYIQGMALFFLSVTFPFFAMALVVPGRQGAFLLWMGLWFWIKSWDFGLAVVMLLDDLLYLMLPHGPPITDEALLDPGAAIKSVLEVDPLYSVNTYYNLLATSIAAVPVLTGLMVKKGGSEITSAISQGFRNFSGRIGSSMSQYNRQMMSSDLTARSHADVYNHVRTAAEQALKDSGLYKHLGQAGIDSVMSKFAGSQKDATQFFGKALAAELAGAASKRELAVAQSKFKAALQMSAWERSLSYQNRKNAAMSVGLGQYSRDFVRNYPGAAQLDVIKQSRHPQVNRAVVDGAVGRFVSVNSVRSILNGGSGANPAAAAVGLLSNSEDNGGGITGAYGRLKERVWDENAGVMENLGNLPGKVWNETYNEAPPDPLRAGSRYSEPIHGHELSESRNTGEIGLTTRAEVQSLTLQRAQEAGFSRDQTAAFMAMIHHESGFNPSAAATTTSASGLGQFVNATWKGVHDQMVASGQITGVEANSIQNGIYPNRFDAEANLRASIHHFKENWEKAEGRASDFSSKVAWMYAYHHDGESLQYGGYGIGREQVAGLANKYREQLSE